MKINLKINKLKIIVQSCSREGMTVRFLGQSRINVKNVN